MEQEQEGTEALVVAGRTSSWDWGADGPCRRGAPPSGLSSGFMVAVAAVIILLLI